jgi:hemerythrin-like domain-containing protein
MMAENSFPTQGGPVGVMLQEHELGRQFTRAMRAAAEKWAQGDTSARQAAVENALGYVALLRQHIVKEDTILFPMADRAIPIAEHPVVLAGFEQVEHEETGAGVHEKYLALAERLRDESLGLPTFN